MGKGGSNSKRKDVHSKDTPSAPVALSKSQPSDWRNVLLGVATLASTVLYVWRKLEAAQAHRAEKSKPSAFGAQARPAPPPSDTTLSMTDHLSSTWDKAAKASDAPQSGRDTLGH